jgi:predicted MFS family arabinose efflux permease
VLGWSPVKAGLAFTPVAVTAMIGNGAGAKLTARIGPRVPMLAGMAVMAGSFALLTMVSVRTGFTVPPVLVAEVALGHPGLVRAAREAFTTSMSATFTISAIGVLAAAALAFLVMRNTKPQPAPAPEPEHELVA